MSKQTAHSILFFSGHAVGASRKASILFMAEALARQNHSVKLVTMAGPLKARVTHRAMFKGLPFNRWYGKNGGGVQGYLWCGFATPFNTHRRVLDALTTPVFSLFPHTMPRAVKQAVRAAGIIIIESGPGLMLVPAIRALNPKAKLIYSVSDRLSTLRAHPLLLRAEQRAVPSFSLIRVPAQVMCDDFPNSTVQYIPHGLEKELFDAENPSPYTGPRQAVSVGDMLFDAGAIATLAAHFPKWTFHLFGRGARTAAPLPNVVMHGEVPFKQLIPYLQHADVGIAPYHPAPMAGYLSQSSLKLIQYTYCRLPIVAPAFAASGRAHVCAYQPADEASLVAAFKKAAGYPRKSIAAGQVLDWSQVAAHMLRAVGF